MAEQGGAAQAGPAVDLRDEDAMRSTLFYMLIDWDGSDLKNVYEPISQQIAYLFAFLLFLLAGLAWRKTKRWNRERQKRPIPYRVVKPPSEVITEAEGGGKKRIVAVLGGKGLWAPTWSRSSCHERTSTSTCWPEDRERERGATLQGSCTAPGGSDGL